MDDKTAELRDIFLDVSDEETVTEAQEESRGSLSGDAPVEERLRSVIQTMRERFGFRTDLDDDDLVEVVQSFYTGDDDRAIADGIEALTPSGVRTARYDLHLLRKEDLQAPETVDVNRLRAMLRNGASPTEAIDRLETEAETTVDPAAVRPIAEALLTRDRIRAVGDRYRAEFEEILEDRALQDRLAAAVREDGLEDATDGMETNVSF